MSAADIIPQYHALRLQLAMIAGREPAGSCFEIRPRNKNGIVTNRKFVRVYGIDPCAAEIQKRSDRLDVWVGCSPRTSYTSGTLADVQRSWCLRADCDDQAASDRLRQFKPRPSMVVRSGGPGRLQAWWSLSQPLANEWTDRANRRIALALGSDTAVCHAAAVMRAVGTTNHKYPAPVECVHLEPVAYTLDQIIGGLPDDNRYQPTPPRQLAAKRRNAGNVAGLISRVAATAHDSQNRNKTLYWAARRAADEGTLNIAHDGLLEAAVAAGLTEREALSTLQSAARLAA